MPAKGNSTVAARIFVLLNHATGHEPLLHVAARLAAARHAEIVAVFVEDAGLLRLRELPFARQLSRLTLIETPLDADVDRYLQSRVRLVKAALAAAAARDALRWSFRVAQESIGALLEQARAEGDLVLIRGGGRQLGQTAELEFLTGALRARESRAPGPIALILDDSPSGDRAFAVASELSADSNRLLLVGLLAAGSAGLRERLYAEELDVRILDLQGAAVADLIAALRKHRPNLLVIARSQVLAEQRLLAALDRALDCPVLVVG